jgi:hypothetical protein
LYVYYDTSLTDGRKVCCLNKIGKLRQFSDRWNNPSGEAPFSDSNKGFVWAIGCFGYFKTENESVLNSLLFLRLNLNLPGA